MILITGGTGLVGAHLLYHLVSSNQKVKAIYRNKSKLANTKQVFATYTDNYESFFNSIDWIEADILDIPSLENAMQHIEYVYHCAAYVSFEPDKYHQLRKTNIEGTANIVNLCLAFNIKKLCYVSSIATLGEPIKNEPITETSIWNPEGDHSVYAITKYGAEMEVWRGTQEGLKAIIVNPGVILGAGIWQYGTGSLFKRAKKGINYFTAGTIGLIAVKDVVAIMVALVNSTITNERFVLVAENWTYKQFLQELSKSVNTKPPTKQAGKGLLSFAWRIDWLKHKLTGKRRQLTKHLAKSLNSKTNYSSKKINTVLNHNFKDINTYINDTAILYLKQTKP
ncbi:MAG: NAD-dependent epimerase/dehydratase family protein [Aestuariibaculum sp.]